MLTAEAKSLLRSDNHMFTYLFKFAMNLTITSGFECMSIQFPHSDYTADVSGVHENMSFFFTSKAWPRATKN